MTRNYSSQRQGVRRSTRCALAEPVLDLHARVGLRCVSVVSQPVDVENRRRPSTGAPAQDSRGRVGLRRDVRGGGGRRRRGGRDSAGRGGSRHGCGGGRYSRAVTLQRDFRLSEVGVKAPAVAVGRLRGSRGLGCDWLGCRMDCLGLHERRLVAGHALHREDHRPVERAGDLLRCLLAAPDQHCQGHDHRHEGMGDLHLKTHFPATQAFFCMFFPLVQQLTLPQGYTFVNMHMDLCTIK